MLRIRSWLNRGTRRDRLGPDAWSAAILPPQAPSQVAHQALTGSASRWAQVVLEATASGEVALELGCGTGAMSAVLAHAGRRIVLLDWSRECLRVAREVVAAAGGHARCLQADVLQAIPLRDGSVDCVWSSGLLEHFSGPELEGVLRESVRVARRTVVSLVPNAGSVAYRVGKWHQERTGTWRWGRENPKHSLRAPFEHAGLRVVREDSVDPEHAVTFLTMPGGSAVQKVIQGWLSSLPPDERDALNQGYLLATVGIKT